MSDKITASQELKRLKKYCLENKIRVPWDQIFSIGIYRELLELLPKDFMTNSKLYSALGHHVRGANYLKRVTEGTQRFGIGYQKTTLVTKAQARCATLTFFDVHVSPKKKLKQSQPKAPVRRVLSLNRSAR